MGKWKLFIMGACGLFMVGCATMEVEQEEIAPTYESALVEEMQEVEEIQDIVEIELTQSEKFEQDAIWFVEWVEEMHPIFKMPEVLPEEYAQVRDYFLEVAPDSEDITDFRFEMERYIRVLRDGHMSGMTFQANEWNINRINRNLYVTADGVFLDEGDGVGLRVISIGGIEIEEIIETILSYFYYENSVDRLFVLNEWIQRGEIHARAGVDTRGEVMVTVSEENGEERSLTARYVSIQREGISMFSSTIVPSSFSTIINYEQIEPDIFYIELTAFFRDDPFHTQTIEAIESAINEGTRDFILDLRDNQGGNWPISISLFEAMGIVLPRTYREARNSQVYREMLLPVLEEAQDFEGMELWLQAAEGYLVIEEPRDASEVKNEYDVNLVVLINEQSYSASVLVASMIQDAGLGVVIGERPRQAPQFFAGMTTNIFLPHTGMQVGISSTRITRADREADMRYLTPDVVVTSEEALDRAVTFIKEG